MPSSRQFPPSPIILLSSNHILKAMITSVIYPNLIAQNLRAAETICNICSQSKVFQGWLSGRLQFGNTKVFFSWSGILACGLENCRDPFGYLTGQEGVESSLQSSQDVLLEIVRPEQASLLPDELTIPLLQFLVFVNLHFTRIESGNIEVISALLPIWLFWTPWDQLGQQQQMCWWLGRQWPVHAVRHESCLWDKSDIICNCVPQTSCSPSSSPKIKAKLIAMGRWWGKAVFSKPLFSYWALCCPLNIQR